MTGVDLADFALTRNGFIDGLSGWPNDLMARYWKNNQLIAEANWSYEQVKRDKTHGTMAEHVDGPPPWRIGGRVGFTVDATCVPDSSGNVLELALRVPPATIVQLSLDWDSPLPTPAWNGMGPPSQ